MFTFHVTSDDYVLYSYCIILAVLRKNLTVAAVNIPFADVKYMYYILNINLFWEVADKRTI